MEIYLIRHGETVWNTLGRFQGQKDSPLTAAGEKQVERSARLLAAEIAGRKHLFQLHVSPLGRTMQTSELIKRHIAILETQETRLMEVTTGSWDGMTRFEIENEYPGALDGSNAFDWYFHSPDGETFNGACTRVREWMKDLSSPTVAVSHGLFGRLVRGVYLDLSKSEMLELPVPQDCIYRLYGGIVELITA